MVVIRRPTAADLVAARAKRVADVIAPDLKILFVGINPGLYTAAVGHHFARPGNRFWPALFAAGYTPRLLAAHEQRELLDYGYGITNVVSRTTAAADELSRAEIVDGGRRLEAKVRRYRPHIVAILGLTTYRTAFARPNAQGGRQQQCLGDAELWVLSNPSGLNAHFRPADFARLFRDVRRAAEA
ncbi:MAG: G/U mismatch-specific DNA glycosylase [Gammaproteobacteria bacterium]|nr:G/U mismatch-specific DNA glycosylase [Gammaproteobacteria bacterium]